MDRREFLKLLGVASVAPVYFFAPRGGWLARVKQYRSMTEVERDFGPGDNPEYDAVNSYFRTRRLQPGDYVGSPFDVGEPFALYDQDGLRIGKGHLVPLDRPTDPVLRLDRGPYRADLVLKKGVVLPKASELSIGYEVGSSRRLV